MTWLYGIGAHRVVNKELWGDRDVFLSIGDGKFSIQTFYLSTDEALMIINELAHAIRGQKLSYSERMNSISLMREEYGLPNTNNKELV